MSEAIVCRATGIIADIEHNVAEAVSVDYQPGNNTRYRVLYLRSKELISVFGIHEKGRDMVSVLGFGSVLVDPLGHWSQLSSMRGLGEADCLVLWELVLHLNGKEVAQFGVDE